MATDAPAHGRKLVAMYPRGFNPVLPETWHIKVPQKLLKSLRAGLSPDAEGLERLHCPARLTSRLLFCLDMANAHAPWHA